MKKEGTGKPRDPEIEFTANVKMRELRFDRVPNPEVDFRGNTSRNSIWGSRRENLPDKVREEIVYRDAKVRLMIASETTDIVPAFQDDLDRERTANLSHKRRNTVKQ